MPYTQRNPTLSPSFVLEGGEEHGVEVVDVPARVCLVSTPSFFPGVVPPKGLVFGVNTEVGKGANKVITKAALCDTAKSVSADPGVWVVVPGGASSKARCEFGLTILSDECPEGVITVEGGKFEFRGSRAFIFERLCPEPFAKTILSGVPAIVDVEVVVHQRVLLETPLELCISRTVGLSGA